MNQDQVKNLLLRLDNTVAGFTVTFTGKSSNRVDGLYKPDTQEILIHNKNFAHDNALIYTAIHEFAHHIQFSQATAPISARAHTSRFWDILHRLLFKAENEGIYVNVFESEQEFVELTAKIRDDFLAANGHLMKEFGGLLMKAQELCLKYQASFDDYVDRMLLVHHSTAKALIKTASLNINPAIGYENMRQVARIRDDDARHKAEEAFLRGMSPDMVKEEFSVKKPRSADPIEELLSEKSRLERTIQTLEEKLARIEIKIREIEEAD